MGHTMHGRRLWAPAALLGVLLLAATWLAPALAAEPPTFELRIKEHRFNPPVLVVPAGQMFKLVVYNDDATPEEFESHSLKREKIIAGNSSAILFIAALRPGTYEFVGEFNEATARGKIIAK